MKPALANAAPGLLKEARLVGVPARDRWQSDIGVRVAFFEVAGTRIELVEYTGPIVERFGCSIVPGFPVDGAHGRIAFLEPEPATGMIVELCEMAVRTSGIRGAGAPPSEASL